VGAYGTVLISDIAKLYYVLNGSELGGDGRDYLAPYNWAMQAFRPSSTAAP
jgi:hyaluronate lyase